MGHRPATLTERPRCSAGAFMLKSAPFFVIKVPPVAQISNAYLPEQFLAIIREALPAHLSMDEFIDACGRPLRRSLRVNTLKISVTDFLALVAPYDWRLTPVPWCQEGFWIDYDDEQVPLGSTAEHLSGLFYIQEASSMLPVSALFAGETMPERVMDVAAAPGSKTTQIAARMGNQGLILANEYSASRVKILHANISRCGIANVALTHFDGRVFGSALPESFDAILLDAPCSGEGVIRKDPHALRNWSLASNQEIAATQHALIDSAFHALRPGGVLVYSTCTLNQVENQQTLAWLLDRYPEAIIVEPLDTLFPGAEAAATPEGYLHVFPQIFDCEGFFVARLRKTAAVEPLAAPGYKVGKFPFTPVNGKAAQDIVQAAQQVSLQWRTDLTLWARDKELWLFPQAIAPLLGKVRFSRIGIKLAETHNKGYRWQHEAVIALAGHDNPHFFELNAEQAQSWYRGQDIYPDSAIFADNVIVTFQQQPLGLARKVGSRLKNSYPRELVRDGRLFSAETQ